MWSPNSLLLRKSLGALSSCPDVSPHLGWCYGECVISLPTHFAVSFFSFASHVGVFQLVSEFFKGNYSICSCAFGCVWEEMSCGAYSVAILTLNCPIKSYR